MNKRPKGLKRRLSEWYVALLLLVGGLAIGAILIVLAEEVADPDTFQEALLREGGLAFLIAALIGSSYEVLQRLHLMRQTEDAIQRIRQEQIVQTLKSLMPAKVYAEVEDHIVDRPLVREYQVVTLVLDWAAEGDREHLVSRCTSQYKLRNSTNYEVTEPVSAFCSKYLQDVFPEGCRIEKVRLGDQELEGSAIPVDEDDSYIRFRQLRTIPPRGELEVECCYTGIHHSRDVWIWVFEQMTESLELTIQHPPELEVEAAANHPREASNFNQTISDRSLKRWELDCAALAGQSVQIAWSLSTH